MLVDKNNAHRIIVTSGYEEKQQGLVDTMLCNWSELGTYNDVYKNLGKLTELQEIDVAQAIIDRRNDKKAFNTIKELKK